MILLEGSRTINRYLMKQEQSGDAGTKHCNLPKEVKKLFDLCSQTFLYRDVQLHWPRGAMLLNFSPYGTKITNNDLYKFSFFFFFFRKCHMH